MKYSVRKLLLGLSLSSTLNLQPTTALAQGTAFTYQGRLTEVGNPATGLYDFRCAIHDAGGGGNLRAGPLTNAAVPVTNGLFTLALDFGPDVFTGPPRWLDVGVRSNGSGDAFVPLSPRQELRPTPYALYAPTAGGVTNSSVTVGQLRTTGAPAPGQILTYDGSSLVWQNPAAASGAWAVAGNNAAAGNFLGTINNQPLVLKGNNARLLQLDPQPGAPNTLGGAPGNYVAPGVEGAVIAGGGTWTTYGGAYTNTIRANYATIGGGLGNLITANAYESTIAGGNQNTAESNDATVGGGVNNHAQGKYSTVAGGESNDATGEVTTVSGGRGNDATGIGATVGGGVFNTAGGAFSAVPGGANNVAAGDGSLASGAFARALHPGSFVWADHRPFDFTTFDSVAEGEFAIRARNGVRLNTDTSLFFGNQTRQMVNLWGASYGVGVQNFGFYCRSGGNFYWYQGGAHHDDVGHPGGGTAMMWLTPQGLSVCALEIRGGCDLAEPFEMSEKNIPKGAVVVIDEDQPGRLKLSTRAYDTRVAGVVSGANGVKPGISLKQEGTLDQGENVALSGRVYVNADAGFGPIKPGDLLTTSDTPGHAMKVADHARSQGAILGKAMSALPAGRGMVLVLVTLQ